MSTLKAAAVSNRVIRHKRKRRASDAAPPGLDELADADRDADVQETPSDGPEQPAKSTRKRTAAAPKPKRAATSNATVECAVEWPPVFKDLDKTHRALNLVYTFCSTRKHLVTTFDTIRSAVESHTKKELSIHDVAAVVALRPEGINFSYVDELMLQTDIRGAERDDTFKSGRSKDIRSQGPAPDASVGGFTGMHQLGDHHPDDLPTAGKEVLYLEFVDGDLKRQVQHKKTGEPTKPSRKLRDEDLKMPVFSQKQMTSLIDKRNQKFSNAVSAFINRCVDKKLDPEVMLRQEAEACMSTLR